MIKVRVSLLAVSVIGSVAVAGAYSTGGRFATSETGGPFPGETNCTRCHQGTKLNAGGGTLQLLINGAPAADHAYKPGETVTLVIQFADPTASRSGFQLTARAGDGCSQPGSLAAGSGSTSPPRINSVKCANQPVEIATHSRATNASSATWNVSWTAPPESVGPVTVAAVVNGANGNQSRTGDKIYNTVAVIQPAGLQLPAPVISDNGVILGDRASMTTTVAPGAIAIAKGSGFAAAAGTVSGAVGEDGRVSTKLGGTCVEVNRLKAPLIRLSNEEVIFQVPFATGLGHTSVQVVQACGGPEERRSNTATVIAAAVKPVFYLFSDNTYGMAGVHTDGVLVGAADSIEGVKSRAALPGDVVTVFGTGLGPTSPALATGEVAVAPTPLAAANVRLMIGEMEVKDSDVVYVGAAPNFAGLYQLSFAIPQNTAPGNHPFSVMLNSVASAAGPKLEIGSVATPSPPSTNPDGPPACTVGLTLKAGASCIASVNGLEATFEVKEDGDACASLGNLSICHSTGALLSTLPLFGAGAKQNDDGSWTVTKLP